MSGLEQARICPLSGQLAGPWCPASMDEVFAAGTRPKTACPMHKIVSAKLPEPIARRCEELGGAEHRLVDLGDEFYDWARMEGMAWMSFVGSGSTILMSARKGRTMSA